MPDLRARVGGLGRADLVSFPPGWVAWIPGGDHHTVISYEARLRADGSGTVLDSLNIGKPIPHSTKGLCYANINSLLSGQSAGNYTLSIAATNASGTTDSDVSSAFSLPLA